MKAEAPKKIYVHEASVSELTEKLLYHIEYTRTDAFSIKAAEYLMDYEFNDSPTIADRRKRVENFKKYMKGE